MTMEAGGWYLVGNAFSDLTGKTTFTIDEVFAGATFAPKDMLYILRDDGVYASRYWDAKENKWSLNPKRFTPDETKYPATTGMYIHKATAGSVTFAGKVEVKTIEFGSDQGYAWNLSALPSPEGKLLSDYTWENCQKGDSLYVSRADGVYKTYYYFENQGWSLNPKKFTPSSEPLNAGQAVLLNKASVGKGRISIKNGL